MVMALILTAVHWPVHAWDGALSGVISAIDSVPSAGQYDFRVYLRDQPGPWCGPTGASGWAAMHSNEPNFKGVQATLMLAFAMGKTVTLYLNRDANNYCKIGYVAVSR
jgi:hypothetical protein